MQEVSFKSPSREWDLAHNSKANCGLSAVIQTQVNFKISLKNLSGVMKALWEAGHRVPEHEEVYTALMEALRVSTTNHMKQEKEAEQLMKKEQL